MSPGDCQRVDRNASHNQSTVREITASVSFIWYALARDLLLVRQKKNRNGNANPTAVFFFFFFLGSATEAKNVCEAAKRKKAENLQQSAHKIYKLPT